MLPLEFGVKYVGWRKPAKAAIGQCYQNLSYSYHEDVENLQLWMFYEGREKWLPGNWEKDAIYSLGNVQIPCAAKWSCKLKQLALYSTPFISLPHSLVLSTPVWDFGELYRPNTKIRVTMSNS